MMDYNYYVLSHFVYFYNSMMTRDVLTNANITRIVGNGSGLSRNKVLQKEVQQLYQLPLVFTAGGDAAKGAAIAVSNAF